MWEGVGEISCGETVVTRVCGATNSWVPPQPEPETILGIGLDAEESLLLIVRAWFLFSWCSAICFITIISWKKNSLTNKKSALLIQEQVVIHFFMVCFPSCILKIGDIDSWWVRWRAVAKLQSVFPFAFLPKESPRKRLEEVMERRMVWHQHGQTGSALEDIYTCWVWYPGTVNESKSIICI